MFRYFFPVYLFYYLKYKIKYKAKIKIGLYVYIKNSEIRGEEIFLGRNSIISNSILTNNIKITHNCSLNKCVLLGNNNINKSDLNDVRLGKYSYVAENAKISETTIGNFTSIGPDVIIGYGNHPTDFLSTSPVFFSKSNILGKQFHINDEIKERAHITIGNDVWIGAKVFIKDGITIGDGSIIAAGAVVTKNVEPYSIVGGVPAVKIKDRFTKEKIDEFLNLKWWYFSDEEIINRINLFTNKIEGQ